MTMRHLQGMIVLCWGMGVAIEDPRFETQLSTWCWAICSNHVGRIVLTTYACELDNLPGFSWCVLKLSVEHTNKEEW